MNFMSTLMYNEIDSQYQNVDLCCAIIIEIKNLAINNMSIIEIKTRAFQEKYLASYLQLL